MTMTPEFLGGAFVAVSAALALVALLRLSGSDEVPRRSAGQVRIKTSVHRDIDRDNMPYEQARRQPPASEVTVRAPIIPVMAEPEFHYERAAPQVHTPEPRVDRRAAIRHQPEFPPVPQPYARPPLAEPSPIASHWHGYSEPMIPSPAQPIAEAYRPAPPTVAPTALPQSYLRGPAPVYQTPAYPPAPPANPYNAAVDRYHAPTPRMLVQHPAFADASAPLPRPSQTPQHPTIAEASWEEHFRQRDPYGGPFARGTLEGTREQAIHRDPRAASPQPRTFDVQRQQQRAVNPWV